MERPVDQRPGGERQPHLVLRPAFGVEREQFGERPLGGAAGIGIRLEPGPSQRLDVGVVTDEMDGRCTISDHDLAGMTLDLGVV